MASVNTHNLGYALWVCFLFGCIYRYFLKVTGADMEHSEPNQHTEDVTALRNQVSELEAQLREHEEFKRKIIEKLPFSLYVFDLVGMKNIWINRHVAEQLGYTLAEIREMGEGFVFDLIHPDDAKQLPQLLARWNTAQDGEILAVEYRMKNKDGLWQWFRGQDLVYKRNESGVVTQIIGVTQDITEQKQAEAERIHYERQIQQAQKLESLGILAGGIAHDFNNILVSILGYTEMSLEDVAPHSPIHENLKEIEKGALRAADLATQMLAYSGKGRFKIEKININAFVSEMVTFLKASISKNAVLTCVMDESQPFIEGDPTQIRQVIMNLIINASESLGEWGRDIVLRTSVMNCDRDYLQSLKLLETLPEGNYVCLEVSDSGCGMSAETKAKLFDPFYTTKFSGRGLGMAAVLGIVRGHNGSIHVYSEETKGSTFKIFLPLVIDGIPDAPPATPIEANTKNYQGLVLLVDDEESILEVGRSILHRAGFEVLCAVNGAEAIKIFKENADKIKCVVLDLTMPIMGGEQCFYDLRKLNGTLPVLISSGFSEFEVSTRFSELGHVGFIQKPYRSAELLDKISILTAI